MLQRSSFLVLQVVLPAPLVGGLQVNATWNEELRADIKKLTGVLLARDRGTDGNVATELVKRWQDNPENARLVGAEWWQQCTDPSSLRDDQFHAEKLQRLQLCGGNPGLVLRILLACPDTQLASDVLGSSRFAETGRNGWGSFGAELLASVVDPEEKIKFEGNQNSPDAHKLFEEKLKNEIINEEDLKKISEIVYDSNAASTLRELVLAGHMYQRSTIAAARILEALGVERAQDILKQILERAQDILAEDETMKWHVASILKLYKDQTHVRGMAKKIDVELANSHPKPSQTVFHWLVNDGVIQYKGSMW